MKPIITFEQRKIIEAMLKDGRTMNFIAYQLGINRSTVYNEVAFKGGVANYRAEEAQHMKQARKRYAPLSTKVLFRLTHKEKVRIKELLSEKRTIFYTARALNRAYSTIRNEIDKHGGIDNYRPKEKAGSLKIESYSEQISQLNLELEVIKQQVEILFDLIKEKIPNDIKNN